LKIVKIGDEFRPQQSLTNELSNYDKNNIAKVNFLVSQLCNYVAHKLNAYRQTQFLEHRLVSGT